MARRRNSSVFNLSLLSCTVLSAGIGLIVLLLVILGFSYVLTKIDTTDIIISTMTSIALCIGAYTGGYTGAKHRRKNGLLVGIICGFIMFAVIFVISIFFAKTAVKFPLHIKLLITLLCGGIGGIAGVNSKNNKF